MKTINGAVALENSATPFFVQKSKSQVQKSLGFLYNNCMSKQNIIQVDYTTYGDNYQFKLPLNIDYIIPKDDSVRLLSQIIEEMNNEHLLQ